MYMIVIEFQIAELSKYYKPYNHDQISLDLQHQSDYIIRSMQVKQDESTMTSIVDTYYMLSREKEIEPIRKAMLKLSQMEQFKESLIGWEYITS